MTIVAAVLVLCLVAASEASASFPMIAFRCDGGPFLTKKLNLTHTHSHTWHDVPELDHEQERENALCANDKFQFQILDVCRYNYPDIEVVNIVESFHDEEIGDWCQHNFHGGQCDADPVRVQPYRCLTRKDMSRGVVIEGPDCQLKIIGDQYSPCLTFKALKESAVSNCTDLSLKLDSVHPFIPCGIGLFRSADYMCCPERRSGDLQPNSLETGAPRHEETDIAHEQRQNRNWTETNNSWFRSFYYPAHAEVDAVTIERFNWSLFAAALSLAVLLLLSLLALVWALFHFLGARSRARKMYCDAESVTGERIAIVGGKRNANLNSYVL